MKSWKFLKKSYTWIFSGIGTVLIILFVDYCSSKEKDVNNESIKSQSNFVITDFSFIDASVDPKNVRLGKLQNVIVVKIIKKGEFFYTYQIRSINPLPIDSGIRYKLSFKVNANKPFPFTFRLGTPDIIMTKENNYFENESTDVVPKIDNYREKVFVGGKINAYLYFQFGEAPENTELKISSIKLELL